MLVYDGWKRKPTISHSAIEVAGIKFLEVAEKEDAKAIDRVKHEIKVHGRIRGVRV
jgi:hypothetical protein